MEDSLKSIRLLLDFCTEDGERIKKEQTIKVNKPTLNEKKEIVWFHVSSIYSLSYSLKIPDFIHSYLLGKEIKQFGSSSKKTIDLNFPKTINSDSIEALTKRWCELIEGYIYLKKLEKLELKKVIFFSFENDFGEDKSWWNSLKLGKFYNIKFKFRIGFVTDKEINKRFNSERELVNQDRDSDLYRFKFVEWTAERELFFSNIQNSFESLIQKLNSLNEEISEEKIDSILMSNILKITE